MSEEKTLDMTLATMMRLARSADTDIKMIPLLADLRDYIGSLVTAARIEEHQMAIDGISQQLSHIYGLEVITEYMQTRADTLKEEIEYHERNIAALEGRKL